ncbi:sodium-coupled monocarboxylate transporter 1-like, partial [Amphiura filiformis]|uniref:sodium-coupled monocarboxylate transporter 1-like n=1 Tax=Amphiura filiformis TaxID=82378 RepID=UPI003B20C21D
MADNFESPSQTFSLFDYVILTLMLLISTAIGIYHAFSGGRQKTTSEFLLADRTVHPIVSALSQVASFISGITMLGTPAETYIYGSMYWLYGFSMIITGFITSCLFIPVFMRLEITSIYEFLYLGIVLYAPALALSAVAGISLWGSVIAIGIICTFYTTIGGMWAVLWTDVFQVIVMIAAFISVIIGGCMKLGGMDTMWQIAEEGGRVDFWDFRVDPTIRHTFWSVVIGGGMTWGTMYCTNQAQLQRCIAVGSLKRAQITLILSFIGIIIVISLACLCGLTMYANYVGCDPLARNRIDKSDQLLVFFIMDLFANAPGLSGFFTSGVFSAALSTLSSSLNALVAVTIEDFVKPFWKDMSDDYLTKLSKLLVLIYGVLVIFIALLVSVMSTEILQLALGLFGIIGGPLIGLFSLGMFFPWTNSKGAISGLVFGLIITLWIGIGALIYPPYVPKLPVSTDGCLNTSLPVYTTQDTYTLEEHQYQFALSTFYSISYAWYASIGYACTVLFGLLISFVTGEFY